jgi:hyperosmotically inducible periplasmic protein
VVSAQPNPGTAAFSYSLILPDPTASPRARAYSRGQMPSSGEQTMHNRIVRAALAAPAIATLLALAACGDRVENTEMPQPDRPSVEINRQGMEGASHADATDTRYEATAIRGGIGNGTPEAGVALDARSATDVRQALQRDAELAAMKIDVSSQEAEVTLRGNAPGPAARDRAAQLARDVRDVKTVENQLTLG